ncbi:MAG: transglutaminaseTgpA domain-containing protein [bacterium]
MDQGTLSYDQQVLQAPRPAGLAYVLFFLLGLLAINTFYLVFEQEEQRFVLWGALAAGFAISYSIPRKHRMTVHRVIDFLSVLTLVYFVAQLTDGAKLQRFGNYLGQMVCGFLVLFSCRTFRQSDFTWLMVISLVIMLLCSIPIFSASFIYSLLGFVFLLAAGLAVLNLYPGQRDHRPDDTPLTLNEWSGQLGSLFGASVLILIICAGLFAGLPGNTSDPQTEREQQVRAVFGAATLSAETRGDAGFEEGDELPAGMGGGTYSGFSDSFDIANGRDGTIQEDTSPILEVQADDMPYMRAIAWDTFTGRSWERSAKSLGRKSMAGGSTESDVNGRTLPTRFVDYRLDNDAIAKGVAPADYHAARIRLVGSTATGKGYLFVPWETVQVRGYFGKVWRDDTGTLQIETEHSPTIEDENEWVLSRGDAWEVYYRPHGPATDDPLVHSLSPEDIARYTALPDVESDRVRELGQSLTAGKSTINDKVFAVQRYLQTRKRYSLTPPVLDSEDRDAVDKWLFESNEGGHCEYFSTSAAVLLRAGGVPCRVVTGFAPGTFNVIKGAWVIRGKDAHAWIEAFDPEHGWMLYDPTPVAWGEDALDQVSAVTARMSRSLEQYFIYDPRGFWTHDVPVYLRQFKLRLTVGVGIWREWAVEPGPLGLPNGLVYGLLGGGGLFFLSTWSLFRRYRLAWGDFAGLRVAQTTDWSWRQYRWLLLYLRRHDPAIPSGLTISDLAQTVAPTTPQLATALDELNAPFHGYHFARPDQRPSYNDALRSAWREVRKRVGGYQRPSP